jgi:Flp pilus assembly protein TadG
MLPNAHRMPGVEPMISFLKRLRRDRRGNVLVIAGAAMPLIMGAAGLATDTIQWTLWNRQLQRAADSAAIAGVFAKVKSEALNAAITTDLARNNHTLATLLGGYPQVAEPGNTGSYTNAVQVTLAVQKVLGFSSFFMSAAPIITTTATAAAVNEGTYCAVGLDPSTTPAITVGGSAQVNLGCGAMSNSTSTTESVAPNGAAYSFAANPVAGAGGLPSSITGSTNLQPNHLPLPDPFAGLYPTDIPAGVNCTNFSQKVTTTTTGTGQNRVTTYGLQPGCFNSFNPGNQTYNLQPGVYYLNNTDFLMNGNAALVGTGVTFILTGTDPGSLQINGTSILQLTAPTTGTYERMLFIQSSNATSGNANTINGDNTSFYDGGMYFPKGDVDFTGSSGAMTKCVMVVAFHINFNGNTNLQNDVVGCAANKTVVGKKIRLIA